jgi:uncharacterized protein involved in outer membrane biogenesis
MTKRNKIALLCFVSALALVLFAATILPIIVRNKAIAAIADETGRKVRIDKVAINPFTLTITISGFAIEAKGGGPFVSIVNLRASLVLASIFKWALIIPEIIVDSPAFSIARLAVNNYSFNDIIDRQKAKPEKPEKAG